MSLNPMEIAVNEASQGVDRFHGGPFGAVIVRDGEIIGRGHNRVIISKDPTAHAEVEAIRDACRHTDSIDLSGSTLYTTCYPCPMCLGAVLWSKIDKVHYCCTSEDVAKIGFSDDEFYNKMNNPEYLAKLLVADDKEKDACTGLLKHYNDTQHELY